jgi:hypothetical protein
MVRNRGGEQVVESDASEERRKDVYGSVRMIRGISMIKTKRQRGRKRGNPEEH